MTTIIFNSGYYASAARNGRMAIVSEETTMGRHYYRVCLSGGVGPRLIVATSAVGDTPFSNLNTARAAMNLWLDFGAISPALTDVREIE